MDNNINSRIKPLVIEIGKFTPETIYAHPYYAMTEDGKIVPTKYYDQSKLRKAAAYHYLCTKDEIKQKHYFELYEYVNEQIKKLLGL